VEPRPGRREAAVDALPDDVGHEELHQLTNLLWQVEDRIATPGARTLSGVLAQSRSCVAG
jgi:hypothetical protein